MDISATECSSGGTSGWTLYLDQSSSSSATQWQRDGGIVVDNEEYSRERRIRRKGAKEEDLSMVSDASSGPPHFNEDEDYFGGENGYSYSASNASQSAQKIDKKKKNTKNNGSKTQHSHTDDTASSPALGFNKNLLKQGFSVNKGKSSFQKHFGSFQSKSEKPTSK